MIQIGIDAREFKKGNNTGIARYMGEFLKYSVKNKDGYEYILFCDQSTDVPIEGSGIKKVVIPGYCTFVWDQIQLPRCLKKEKIDIFLTPYFKAPLFAPCKVVVVINDLIPIKFSGYRTLTSFFRRLYFKLLAYISIKRADRVVTISNYSKKDLIDTFHIKKDKIKVLALPVGEIFKKLYSIPEDALKKYNIHKKFIFYFGNFKPHKNVKTLLEAYKELPLETREEYSLVIGGKPDNYYKNIVRSINKLGLKDDVIFTGFLKDQGLVYLYNAASIFVFPSLYEGFGYPPLESMACGTPVVAFKRTSLPEVIKDTGVLLESSDFKDLSKEINNLLINSRTRDLLSVKCLERAKYFTIDKMSRELLGIFQELHR
ncbi:MAG: glycosyltransferase family 1 protein [Candidatus Omnitrophota bacterium]